MNRIIFVLGMHRSGTSLTTGILNALGIPLGDELIPPDANNRMGYFESPSVGRIHDRLLRALGSSWYASTTVSPLPNGWWRLPQVEPFKRELSELAKRQLAVSGGTWAFKDPRACRLMPLWHDILAETGAQPAYLLVVRNPQEVARSLQSRDGLSALRSEMLWLEHTAEAILAAPACLNAIVDYDRWFSDPRAQAGEMAAALGVAGDAQLLDRAVSAMVAGDLRHHRAEDAAFQAPLVRDLYDALRSRDRERIALLTQIFSIARGFGAAMLALSREPEPKVTVGV